MSRGIPRDAIAFYRELTSNNTREWWDAHKPRYLASVREPMEELADALEDEFGPGHVYRPQRDMRFSADKTPYKTHQGMLAGTGKGMGWYVQISAEGLYVAGGFHRGAADQTQRLRAGIDAPVAGQRLAGIVEALLDQGFDIGGDRLKTRPRGVSEDHPRIELMRHKALTAARSHGAPAWLETAEVVDRVRADWRAMTPLITWLDEHVGATTLPRR